MKIDGSVLLSFLSFLSLAAGAPSASAQAAVHGPPLRAAHATRGQGDYSWRYYRVGNTGIQGDYSEALWVGPDGDPYIGGYDPIFEEGGFSKYVQAEDRWVNYSNVDLPVIGHPNDLGSSRVTDIVPEATGRLWLGTWRGALTFDPALGASSIAHHGPGDSLLTDDRVWDVDRAPDGTIWFVNNGIVRYDPASDGWTSWPAGLTGVAAQPKAGGGYLVWTSEHPPFQSVTMVFDSATQAWTTLTPTGAPGEILGMPGKDCVDEAGNFWALRSTTPGDWNSLDYRRPDGTWVAPPEPYASVAFYVWAFKAYGDRQAVLADEQGTVYRFNGTSWKSLGVWRPGAFTYAVDVDAAGAVWASGNGGAARYEPTTGKWQRYRVTNTSNYDDFNRDLTIDEPNGHVYAGANAGAGTGGMVRFDGTRWVGWNQATYGLGYDWPFPNDWCQALAYRPSNGRIAVSPLTWLYGIHEWTGTGFHTLLPSGGAVRMCEDSLGRLWSLGEYFSLSYLAGGRWTSVPLTGWGSKIVKDPTVPGAVWASTGNEFLLTNGGALHVSRTISDFPELLSISDQFSGLAADQAGVAWIGCTVHFGGGGTGGGLIRFDAATGTYQMLRYDQGWPFPGQYVSPLAVSPDGCLWMQYDTDYPFVARGLCSYDGESVMAFPAPPGGEPQWGGLPHAQIEDLEVRAIPGGYELWMTCVSRGIAVLTVRP